MTDAEDVEGSEEMEDEQRDRAIQQARSVVLGLDGPAQYARTAEVLLEHEHYLTLTDTGEILRFDDGVWVPDGKNVIEARTQAILRNQTSRHKVREVRGHIRRQTFFDREDLGAPEGTIAVENGLLDLESRQLQDLRPEHLALRRLPVTFDSDAQPDHFLSFMDDFVDPDERQLLQEFVGYALMHWTYRHHAALLLVGTGGNGKTTFLNTVTALLGEASVSTQTLHRLTNNRFAPAQLFGKLANIGPELNPLQLRQTGQFKALVGGDRVTAERKHEDQFTFTNRAKLLFSTNEIPETDDDSDGFFRRWRIVECTNTFPEDDPETDTNLGERLTAAEELSGVLNWALDGLDRLRKDDGFTQFHSLEERRILWMSYGSSVGRFFVNHLQHAAGETLNEQQVYGAYREFCDEEQVEPEAKKDFTRKLKSLTSVKQRRPRTGKDRTRVYAGIEWKPGSRFHPARLGGQQAAITE